MIHLYALVGLRQLRMGECGPRGLRSTRSSGGILRGPWTEDFSWKHMVEALAARYTNPRATGPMIIDVQEDAAGLLWVLHSVRDPTGFSLVQ